MATNKFSKSNALKTTAAILAAHTLSVSAAKADTPSGVCAVSQKVMAEELQKVLKNPKEKISLARFTLASREQVVAEGISDEAQFQIEFYTSDVFGEKILSHENFQLERDPKNSDRLIIKEYGGSGSSPLKIAYVKSLSGNWTGEQLVEIQMKYSASSDSPSIGPVKAKCYLDK